MTNKVNVAITNAVYEVYKNTTSPYRHSTSDKTVIFTVPTDLGDLDKSVRIVRRKDENSSFYELYIKDDKDPFVSVFGCWPIGFVADIFIKTLEHYFDWY